MRWIVFAVAMFTVTEVIAAGTAPKGCYEKIWTKAELKKLPLQQVTAIRLEGNLAKQPESKPQAHGKLMARFRETGETWLATQYECSDTGAGFACATLCDGAIFVLTPGGSGVQVMPPNAVGLFGPDCSDPGQDLKMNRDKVPFVLARRGGKACPAK